jgi:hypothetical protein
MPRLVGREEFERRIQRVIDRAHRRYRDALVRAIGWPPKWTPEAEEVLAKIERAIANDETAALLALVFVAGADNLRRQVDLPLDPDRMAERAERYAQRRATELGRRMAETTRDRLRRSADIARDAVDRIPDASNRVGGTGRTEREIQRELEADVKRTMGRDRSEGVSIGETSKGSVQGERGARDEVRNEHGIELVAYWRHSGHRPKGHAGAAESPCPICTPLEGRNEYEWPLIHPSKPDVWDGPAAHPWCDCGTEYVAVDSSLLKDARAALGIK